MFGLAQDGQAPAVLKRTTKGGLPYVAISLTISFSLLAFMNVSNTGGVVFQYLYTVRPLAKAWRTPLTAPFRPQISAITCILAWITILFTYLRFRAGCIHQGIDRTNLPCASSFTPACHKPS